VTINAVTNAPGAAVLPSGMSIPALVQKLLPSVVSIDVTGGGSEDQGTGMIITKAGLVITNNHVIAAAVGGGTITVTRSGSTKSLPATLVGTNPIDDVALIRINGASKLPTITFGNSNALVAGDAVVAIGNALGLAAGTPTVTQGIVSALGRTVTAGTSTTTETLNNMIQTDAAINPGNSGGPLLNSRGEVIGINTMIASNGADQSSGIGFAIPINTAKAVLADLTRYGRVKRPSLGIVSYGIGPDLASQMGLAVDSGVLIQKVISGGAAEQAGLRGGDQQAYVGNTPIMLGGDLIVAIDGQGVSDPQDINALMDKHQAGDTISVTLYRGKKQMTLKLILGEARDANT
jgi:S1-C subfamily serine protease